MSITMYRGDSRDQEFIIKYSTGTVVNLTSAAITLTVKLGEKDTSAIFSLKNLAAGGGPTQIEMTAPTLGKFVAHMTPTQTGAANITGNSRYWYDIQVVLNSKVYTVVKDRITFTQDITT